MDSLRFFWDTEARLHDLKIWPMYFGAVKSRRKTFEFRLDDRGFASGDYLLLREWDNYEHRYTGNQLFARVTYKLKSVDGLDEDYCILAIELVEEKDVPLRLRS